MPRSKRQSPKPEPEVINAEPVEGEFIPRETRFLKRVSLDLSTSKKYAAQLLYEPVEVVMKMVDDQIKVKLLLINEMMLKWLEILDGDLDPLNRAEAASHLQMLQSLASSVGQDRIILQKSLGVDLAASLPGGQLKKLPAVTETSIEDFDEKYKDALKLLPRPVNIVREDLPKA